MRPILARLLPWLVLAMLNGCAEVQLAGGKHTLTLSNHAYERALAHLEHGHVMQARRIVTQIPRSNSDYSRAQILLRKRIEPARKKLLNEYLARAKKAETSERWADALHAYEQAEALSLQPSALESKRQAMELKLRAYRFTQLLRQRREEDRVLLGTLETMDNLRGLDANDPVIEREKKQRLSLLEERARQARRAARRYLDEGLPEMAYIAIESYLRLDPDSERGQHLRAKILSAMPKAIKVPDEARHEPVKKRLAVHKPLSKKQIEALLRKGQLLEAHKAALVYRRNGGKGGDKLLRHIEQRMDRQASAAYDAGRKAFQQEQLGRAIQFWRQAVALKPDQREYVEALRRAQLLKERLDLIH
ncbi:MAG: hypothetical protein D6678_04000 [Zetaproteobacteria bacterium]|nr:MAG: hypothetical protein D6678_04000 [Zetaproteobacteria bacterium]